MANEKQELQKEARSLGIKFGTNDSREDLREAIVKHKKGGKKEKMVEVKESTLEAILASQKKQDATNKENIAKIKRLEAVADKGRLGVYDERDKSGDLIRTARIGMIDGALVYGWSAMLVNKVGVVEGKVVVDQQMEVFLENLKFDPSKQEDKKKNPKIIKEVYEYLRFSRALTRVTGEIIKSERGADGHFKTLRLDDGREIRIDIRFINV